MLLLFLWLLAAEPNLTLTTDAPARIELDGKSVGQLLPGATLRLETGGGAHTIIAIPASGGAPWRKAISVPAVLSIPMRAHIRRIEIQSSGMWTDDRTGLTWAAADNGSGVTVSQAHSYCRQLATGGFHDWRLPEIDELQTIFGGPSDERGFRVVAPLKLSGWAWSATRGNEPAENWSLDLGDGARASVAAGDAGLNRALCVRNVSTSPYER